MPKYLVNGITVESSLEMTEEDLDEAAKFFKSDRLDLLERIGGTSPEQLAQQGHPVAAEFQKAGKELATIPLNFANMATLNNLRGVVESRGIPFPEPQTEMGKIASGAAGIGGLVAGPSKFLKGGSLLSQMAQGAAMGFAFSPEDITDVEQRTGQALGGAALGGAFGLGQRAIGGLPALSKRFLGNKATQASQAIQRRLRSVPKDLEDFSVNKLGIPRGALQVARRKGIRTIEAIKTTTDDIFQKIVGGFEKFKAKADRSYEVSLKSFKGRDFNADGFFRTLQNGLRRKGWIDQQGNTTTKFKTGLSDINDRLTVLHQELKPIATQAGKKIKGTVLTKEDFKTYRDALGSMLRDKPSDVLVMQSRNALYNSAEKAGFKGLNNAKTLESKYFKMFNKHFTRQGQLKSLGKENTLNRYHRLTKDQQRQLKEIENFTGENFIDDLESVTASQELQKIRKFKDARQIQNDFIEARNPEKFDLIKDTYRPLLGEQTDDFFKAVVQSRNAQRLRKALIGIGAGATIGGLTLKGRDILRGEGLGE